MLSGVTVLIDDPTQKTLKLCDNLVLNQVSKGRVSSLLSRAVGSDQYVGEV